MAVDNKAIARRLYEEVFEGQQMAVADELVDPQARDLSDPQDRRGPARVKEVAAMLHAAFPDQHWDIAQLIAEHDAVVMWSRWSGTHRGTFMGIPATGRPVSVRHVYRFRLRDGKIVEYEALRDDLAFMQQLQAGPPA